MEFVINRYISDSQNIYDMTDKIILILPDGNQIEKAYSISDLLTLTVCGTLIRFSSKDYKVVKKVRDMTNDGYALILYLEEQ